MARNAVAAELRFESLPETQICVKSELTQFRGVPCYGWREQNAPD